MSDICPVERGGLGLEDEEVIVAMGRSSDSSRALSSSSLFKWATFSSYEPFSNLAILTDLLSFGGSFAYKRLSIIFCAWSPNAFSALWINSSRKSGNFIVFGSKTKRCHLCLAVACDSGLTNLRHKMIITSSRVCLLADLMSLNVWRAFFLSREWKWLIFICSVISGCILIMVWKRSSNNSNFSLLPSNVMVFELTRRMVSSWAVGRFVGIFVKTSANLLNGSGSTAVAILVCAGIVVPRLMSS